MMIDGMSFSTLARTPIVWLPYFAGATSFIALVSYVLILGASGDVRVCVWLFVVSYPILTLPVIVTYQRLCDPRFCAGMRTPALCTGGWLVPLLIGGLPAVSLLVGRFVDAPRGYAKELPLFLALLATVAVFLVLARSLSAALARLPRRGVRDSAVSLRGARTPLARFLAGLYVAAAAAMMLVALIPFGPIWYTSTTVVIAMVAGSIAMACCGIFLLVGALKRHQHFAMLMAGLFMSAYVATVITGWHVIRHLVR